MKKTIVDNCSEHWTREFFFAGHSFAYLANLWFLRNVYRFEPKELKRANNLDTHPPFVNYYVK